MEQDEESGEDNILLTPLGTHATRRERGPSIKYQVPIDRSMQQLANVSTFARVGLEQGVV